MARPHEFGQRQLSAEECHHDDAEFEDEIGGGHLERYCGGETHALTARHTTFASR